MSKEFGQSKHSYTPYGCGESTSSPPTLTQDTSSAVLQVWLSADVKRFNRRLHMFAKRKWVISDEFWQSGFS